MGFLTGGPPRERARVLIGRVKPLRPASALGPRGGRGEDSARWARRSGGGGAPRPTNPTCSSSYPRHDFHRLLRRYEERARVGEEEGAALNRNRGFGNFLGSQRTYALFPRRSTEEAPRPPGAPGDGARTDARLPEASGCGSGVAFPLVSSSGCTRRSRGDRGRLRPRRRLSGRRFSSPVAGRPVGNFVPQLRRLRVRERPREGQRSGEARR